MTERAHQREDLRLNLSELRAHHPERFDRVRALFLLVHRKSESRRAASLEASAISRSTTQHASASTMRCLMASACSTLLRVRAP